MIGTLGLIVAIILPHSSSQCGSGRRYYDGAKEARAPSALVEVGFKMRLVKLSAVLSSSSTNKVFSFDSVSQGLNPEKSTQSNCSVLSMTFSNSISSA